MVERRVAGTRTSAVDAERSRRRESTSDTAKYHVLRFVKLHLIHGPWVHTFYVNLNEDSKGIRVAIFAVSIQSNLQQTDRYIDVVL